MTLYYKVYGKQNMARMQNVSSFPMQSGYSFEKLEEGSVVSALCRGDASLLQRWMGVEYFASYKKCAFFIFLGGGVYGYTMGMWHGVEMGLYVAVKFPLLILCVMLVNGLINGLLAIVIGSDISMRQSMSFLMMGFAVTALILGGLSPLLFYISLNAPLPIAGMMEQAQHWHSMHLLMHTMIVAYAGITAHRVLLKQVRSYASSRRLGTITFIAWLMTNLFVGAQLSWVMRPFFGSPGLEVQFLRSEPFRGTFYEAVWNSAKHLIF